MTGPRRRAVLGLLAGGTAALAGCSDLQGLVERPEPTITPAEIRDITSGTVPAPDPVVAIDADERLVDTHRERVVDLLREVPTPLTADHVPNAAVRKELSDAVEFARERQAAASEADRREARFRALRDAREHAGVAAWTWRAIDEGATLEDVAAAAADLQDVLAAAERDREYVGGDDLVRTLLAHGAIEARFDAAARQVDLDRERGHGPGGSGAVAVGEAAGRVEVARANLDGATVRYDAYRESLDEQRAHRDRLATTVETLRETVASRQPDLPNDWDGNPNELVEPTVDETPAGRALQDLAYAVHEPSTRFQGGANRLASTVLSAHQFLFSAAGYETLRERIERGDHRQVTSAADVRELRTAAVDAIESALGTTPGERLTRRELVTDASAVARADQELGDEVAHSVDPVPVRALTWPLSYYQTVALTAAATPDASATVVDALRD
jgi:hypothetical protein